jgi:hypothetical protein
MAHSILAYDFEQLFCGCRPLCKSFLTVLACDRVRSSVKPSLAALSEATGQYGDLRIGSKSCSRVLSSKSCTGFPNPDRFDHAPIQVIDFSHILAGDCYCGQLPVTPSQPRPGFDNLPVWSAWPIFSEPFYLPVRSATSILGFLASIRESHAPCAGGLRLAHLTRVIAPMISSLRMSACPAFDIRPSLSFPPDENCRGTRPSQAAKSRPHRKFSIAGAKASTSQCDQRSHARHGL